MSKKIIAILLVFTLVITCFVACRKEKPETTKINGEEFVVHTDDEGNTIINDQNMIAINPTDANGEVITYENGEPQTNWVQMHGDVQGEDFVQSESYKMYAISGWTPGMLGKIFKNDTDEKCYVQFVEVSEVSKDVNLSTYLSVIDKNNEDLKKGFTDEGYNCTIENSDKTITDKELDCEYYLYKITDAEGQVIHYAENYYFATSEYIYKVAYVCESGIGYDETFDFEAYLNTSFTFYGE